MTKTYGPYSGVASGTTQSSAPAWQTYADLLVNTYGAAEVWPLENIESGTAITAYVDTARNGSLTGWTLQNGSSPLTGSALLTPYLDGALDYASLYTASLAALFNGATGALRLLCKPSVGAWTDGAIRRALNITGAAGSQIAFMKRNTNNLFWFLAFFGNVASTVAVSGISSTDWLDFVLTWDITAGASGEVKAFINGSQTGTTQTGMGTWAGPLNSAFVALGGQNSGGASQVWDGWLDSLALWAGSCPTPAQVAAMYAAL